MVTALIIFAGMMAGGGLLLRRQLRLAPLVEEAPARSRSGRPSRHRWRPRPARIRPARTDRGWRRRLKAEERRQRPQEGRN